MVLNIKDPETDRLARELAAAAGESLTEATRRALEERLERIRLRGTGDAVGIDLADLIARGRARAVLDQRSDSDVVGYDDSGLPR